jgi:hypothetical protein
LLKLDPDGPWKSQFRELEKKDVRIPQEDDDPDDKQQQRNKKKKKPTLGEGNRQVSWIWRVGGTDTTDTGLGEGGY